MIVDITDVQPRSTTATTLSQATSSGSLSLLFAFVFGVPNFATVEASSVRLVAGSSGVSTGIELQGILRHLLLFACVIADLI